MSSRFADALFQLVHSLEKAEKRHFKLYIKRSSSNENLKIVQLFDAIDRLQEYDEKALLRKLKGIEKPQLSNLKAHLYRQILASLRLLKSADSIDLQLNEQFDYAHILYKKGLFNQSLRILERAKETARTHQKFYFLAGAIALEKRIESLHITRSMQDRAEQLSGEALEVSRHIEEVTRLSNLSVAMYSWYVRNGHARNEEDEAGVRSFLRAHLPEDAFEQTGFYERLYLYQSYSWYGFIRQNFLQYYRYSQKWVDLFEESPLMKRVETGHYIKGLHNLLNAHFDLRNFRRFDETLQAFEAFAETPRVQENDNFLVQCFIYITLSKLNRHFMQGTFSEGLPLVPLIEEKLEAFAPFLDAHRVLVFNYKIATLYFGSGDFSTCIDYLQKIIHQNSELRYDLQCYARLMHLLAHFELGNAEIIDHLIRSVYRFMARMNNLTVVEEEIFRFLRSTLQLSRHRQRPGLEQLYDKIRGLEKNRYETRAFAYLDIISWVQSKVEGNSMSAVIRKKYEDSRRK